MMKDEKLNSRSRIEQTVGVEEREYTSNTPIKNKKY